MKRVILVFVLITVTVGFAAAQAVGNTLYVNIKTLTLKSGKGFFTANKGTLKYGDKVTVTKIDGKFAEIKSITNSSQTGWTATANLSKRIVAESSVKASAKELALAGKGFSQETEKSLKTQKKNLNYADVDKTEMRIVREKEVKKFLEEGRLKTGDSQ